MKSRRRVRLGRLSPRAKGQSGQIIIEYILLLVVVVGVAAALQRGLRETSFMQTLAYQPWGKLDGMIQCGAWMNCGFVTPARGIHPESGTRAIAVRPD